VAGSGPDKNAHRATASPRSTFRLSPTGWDGIVRADRTPQRDYWEARAVYAPVALPADAVHFWPAKRSAVPIRNDYDFTELSTVGVRWSLMADDRELAKEKPR